MYERDSLKAYFRMLSVHNPYLGNELVDVLDAYLDAKFKREWQGLTDEEIRQVRHSFPFGSIEDLHGFAHSIEAKVKEKNG